MIKKILFYLTLLCVITTPVMAQYSFLDKNPEVAAKVQLYEVWVSGQMAYYNLPGLAMGIVYDQDLIWQKGFGYSDLEKKTPMTPETLFRIASITKVFTSTAIMQLRDTGKLRLDDPITQYLPWFKIKNRFDDSPQIKIWHLLTHTSGLPGEAAFPYWTDRKFPTVRQIRETLPNQEIIYPTGSKYSYSNLGLALLGQIVVAASGEDYESYIQKNILDPLEMKNTCVFLTDKHKKKLATGYGIRLPDGTRDIMPFTDSKGLTPAANMSSNVVDMAKFISLQFRSGKAGGKQILRGSTLREMQRVQWLRPNWSSGRGLGFSIRRYGDRTLVGHGGWVAGYRTQIYFDVDDKIGVIVMSNGEDGDPAMFARRLFDVVAPEIHKAVQPAPTISKADPEWKNYLGRYEDPTKWAYQVLILNNKLVLYGFDYPPEDNPESAITELTPIGKHTFRMADENGNGELVIFEMGDDGRVKRIKKGENYIYPVK